MTMKEYRMLKGLKQTALAVELQGVCPGIDASLISKIENGMVKPSEQIQMYLDMASETSPDDLQVTFDAISDGGGLIYQADAETPLKTEILSSRHEWLYKLIAAADSEHPAERDYLAGNLGINDRDLRIMIQELRNAGCWIYSSGKSKGYWICENDAQKKELLQSYHSRRVSCEFTEWALTHKQDPFNK